jgi:hypothetical protein
VLPSDVRDLKTPNAARMIPIATFMEPFDDLVKYAEKWAYSVLKSDDTDGTHCRAPISRSYRGAELRT